MQSFSRANKSLKAVSKNDHIIHFYPADKNLSSNLSKYIIEGLAKDETCLIIATPETIININKIIRCSQINLMDAIDKRQYIVVDAEDLLNSVMINLKLDPKKFLSSLTGFMNLASKRARPTRAFVEMLSVLLDKGNIEAMKQLETEWNDLYKKFTFTLYCAYPKRLCDRISKTDSDLFDELRSSYSSVIPASK